METDKTADPKRAIVIVAHCDDIEFSCAGTVACWVRDGWEVIYVICTDSSKGSEDPEMSPQKLAQIRVEEQKRAAEVVGVNEVVFLGYEDGTAKDDTPLRKDLVRLIRKWRPQRAIVMDPTSRWGGGGYINHPDHIEVANAAMAAIYPFARNRPTFPELLAEGLEPHKVAEVYVRSFEQADFWVDVGEVMELKIRALKEHKSQLGEWDPEGMMYEWARENGRGQLIEYAESFKLLRLD